MGKKYGSLHIISDSNNELIEKIMSVYQNETNLSYKKLQTLLGDIVDINTINGDIFVVLHNKIISIFDESLSFESIKEKACKLSQKLNLNTIYISNFEYDIFMVGLISNGKIITSFQCGDGLGEFSLQEEKMDMDLIMENLHIQGVTDINLLTNIEEIEDIIGYEWLKIPTYYDEEYFNDKFNVLKKRLPFNVLVPSQES